MDNLEILNSFNKILIISTLLVFVSTVVIAIYKREKGESPTKILIVGFGLIFLMVLISFFIIFYKVWTGPMICCS